MHTVLARLAALCLIFTISHLPIAAHPKDSTHISGYVNIDGRMIYFEQNGSGEHTIVLIHGFSLSSKMWDNQFKRFSSRYRVVRYDMTGYGSSSVSDSLVSSSDELAALLKKLQIGNAVIIGMSLGGAVATRFAVDYPNMVEAVIAVDASLEGFQFSAPLRARLGSYPRIAKDSGLEKAKDAWLKDPFMTPLNGSPAIRKWLSGIIQQWSGKQFTNPALWGFKHSNPPALQRLGEISVPVLAIVGEKDGPDMHAIADTIASIIPNAKKVVLSGAGHLVTLEQPESFNTIVLDYLAEVFNHK
jgi:pimeloyl-ACP methyl ester carboxylesterase